MSYTAPQYVDTKEQAILALASTIKGEAVTGGDGSVNKALDILADVLAEQDVSVPQTDAGAILALAQYASGMVKPEGTIAITENGEGIDVAQYKEKQLSAFRNEHIGFVFQFHQLLPEFTAVENVMMPALIGGASMSDAHQRAMEMLDYLHLTDRATHKPAELSGGEKQRVAVARALVNRPQVILADEPSGSLDTQNKEELHRLFFDLRDQLGQTFIIVTHDETLASTTDRTIRLRDGRVEL